MTHAPTRATVIWWNAHEAPEGYYDDWERTAQAIVARVNIGLGSSPPAPRAEGGQGVLDGMGSCSAEMLENAQHQAREEARHDDPGEGDEDMPF